jgi:hypothetical protein
MLSQLRTLQREQLTSLLAGFVCMLIYGSAYTYGTLIPYVTSYLYYSGKHPCMQATTRSPPTKWRHCF